jgi:hypothetical protein
MMSDETDSSILPFLINLMLAWLGDSNLHDYDMS